jgi:aspartyl-tRNA(Asn)/glutamyl-tRNA(Gln) amidotransferase subunit A
MHSAEALLALDPVALPRIIETLNPVFNAFSLVSENALSESRASEARWLAGQPKGLLDGVPVSIKDLILTKGWPTLRGSKTIDPKGPWNDDAPATARLREHGAVLLGKTTTPEFGWKGVTDSPLTGITRNPWNPDKTPGGSSGGAAAAVASGMGPLAVGTDGGGSIRIRQVSAVLGLKPTFGRVAAWPASLFTTLAHAGSMSAPTPTAPCSSCDSEPDTRDWYQQPPLQMDFAGSGQRLRGAKIAFSPRLGWVEYVLKSKTSSRGQAVR